MAQLLVLKGADILRAVTLDDTLTRPLNAGRSEDCWLQLLDEKTSRIHALFFPTGEPDARAWAVRDLDSANGTFVNGDKITERVLKHNDTVRIGNILIKYVTSVPEATAVASEPDMPDADEIASYKTVMFSDFPRGRAVLESQDDRARDALKALIAMADMIRDSASKTGKAARRATARDIMAAAADILLTAIQADRVTPLLVSANNRISVIPRKLSGAAARVAEMPMSHTIAKYALKNHVAVMTRPRSDERFQSAKSIHDQGIGTAMCAPVLEGDTVLSLIYCDRIGLDAVPFDDSDLDVLTVATLLLSTPLSGLRERASLAAENRRLKSLAGENDELIGGGPEMAAVNTFIARAAPSDAGVLISGESGTGKELVARAIHAASARAAAPMETVNCAAMTDTLIESELFGHVKGAFTGATGDRIGRFEAADGGTLFLDEIGELPLHLQTKLLRVLEYGEFSRVGETATRKADVRIIAATNRDLEEEVARGRFRKDLFFRLNILRVTLPPLRDRDGDILTLATHFIESASRRMGRAGMTFSRKSEKILMRYTWPGNVRELKNLTERLAVLAPKDVIEPDDLPPEFSHVPQTKPADPSDSESSEDAELLTLAEAEKKHILNVLRYTGGNKKRAADILGIDRSTLYSKLKQYGETPGE